MMYISMQIKLIMSEALHIYHKPTTITDGLVRIIVHVVQFHG